MYKESLMMHLDEGERFQLLSQKLLDQTALTPEINEFYRLLERWRITKADFKTETIFTGVALTPV